MKLLIKVVTLYFLLLIPALAETESISDVCNETSFLKCTNKNKQECKNSFDLTIDYCAKKHEKDYDFNDRSIYTKNISECINNSTQAYFDNNIENFNVCFSKTKYNKKLKKESINVLCSTSVFVKCLGISSKECVNRFTYMHEVCTSKDGESVCNRKKVAKVLKINKKKLKVCATKSGIINNGSE